MYIYNIYMYVCIYRSIYLSIYLSIYVSIYLSIYDKKRIDGPPYLYILSFDLLK